MDAKTFAARDGAKYTVRTLVWWRSELRRRGRDESAKGSSTPPPSIPLMRVQVEPRVSRGSALEVVVGDGIIVRVPSDADIKRVAELVSALAEARS